MVDYEVSFVVDDVREEGGEVVAAEVEEEAAEREGGLGGEEAECYKTGEVGACRLEHYISSEFA